MPPPLPQIPSQGVGKGAGFPKGGVAMVMIDSRGIHWVNGEGVVTIVIDSREIHWVNGGGVATAVIDSRGIDGGKGGGRGQGCD